MKNKILKYITLPFIAGVIGMLLLFAVSLIPQSMVQKNASASAHQLDADEITPRYINFWDWSYGFDNHTDTLIVMESYNLETFQDALLNPYRNVQKYEGEETYISDAFIERVDEGADNDTIYVRYWQGFRIFIRPMLMVFPYFQLRQVVSWVFFGLMFFMLAALAERKGVFASLCIGLAIIFVNPSIISHSLQFTPCFIISFAAILFLLFTENLTFDRGFAFCAFGMMTQYFDFYTAPIATCGLPLLVWLMIDESSRCKYKTILKSFAAWAYGYASLWLVKLVMVTLFTDYNGLADGLGSFIRRIGVKPTENVSGEFTPVGAFIAAWDMVTPGATGAIALAALAFIVAVSALIIWKKQGIARLLDSAAYLAVAALPIIWFSVASQPTTIHAYFQYRPLVVFFAGIFLFALEATPFKNRNLLRK
ncbi:MAG: hypothetical protein E7483_03495 [Ruminococcaceae bacterium]|nr:hypothetical protein [Oscillospiraceae bacterium]